MRERERRTRCTWRKIRFPNRKICIRIASVTHISFNVSITNTKNALGHYIYNMYVHSVQRIAIVHTLPLRRTPFSNIYGKPLQLIIIIIGSFVLIRNDETFFRLVATSIKWKIIMHTSQRQYGSESARDEWYLHAPTATHEYEHKHINECARLPWISAWYKSMMKWLLSMSTDYDHICPYSILLT